LYFKNRSCQYIAHDICGLQVYFCGLIFRCGTSLELLPFGDESILDLEVITVNLSSLQIVDIAEEAGVEYWETKTWGEYETLFPETVQTFMPRKLSSEIGVDLSFSVTIQIQ